MVYVLLGIRLLRVRVVTLPEDELSTSKLPVETARIVPAGLPFNPNCTDALVLYIAKLTNCGTTDNVHVLPVTDTGLVDPPTFKLPAINP
jgi:hypothetical protein